MRTSYFSGRLEPDDLVYASCLRATMAGEQLVVNIGGIGLFGPPELVMQKLDAALTSALTALDDGDGGTTFEVCEEVME